MINRPTPVRIGLSRTGPDPDTGLLSENRTTVERERDTLVEEQVGDLRRKGKGRRRQKKSESVRVIRYQSALLPDGDGKPGEAIAKRAPLNYHSTYKSG